MQPALWERYHDQVKEWESAMSRKHNFSDGYKEKVVVSEKPPMFAFCLRPRGLEAPNKGTKQRSQRKFMVLGHHSGVFGDTDGLQITGNFSAFYFVTVQISRYFLSMFLSLHFVCDSRQKIKWVCCWG